MSSNMKQYDFSSKLYATQSFSKPIKGTKIMNLDTDNDLFNAIVRQNQMGFNHKFAVSYEQNRMYTGGIMGKKCDWLMNQKEVKHRFTKTCYMSSKSHNATDRKDSSFNKDDILRTTKIFDSKMRENNNMRFSDFPIDDIPYVPSIFRQNFQMAKKLTEYPSRKKFAIIKENALPANPRPTPESNNRVRVKVQRKDPVPKFTRPLQETNKIQSIIVNGNKAPYYQKKEETFEPGSKGCYLMKLINKIEESKLMSKVSHVDNQEKSTSQSRTPRLAPIEDPESLQHLSSYDLNCKNRLSKSKILLNDYTNSPLDINQINLRSHDRLQSSIVLHEKNFDEDGNEIRINQDVKCSKSQIRIKNDSTPRIRKKKGSNYHSKDNLMERSQSYTKRNLNMENELNGETLHTEPSFGDNYPYRVLHYNTNLTEPIDDEEYETSNDLASKNNITHETNLDETNNSYDADKPATKKYWMPVKYTMKKTGKKLIGNLVKNSMDKSNINREVEGSVHSSNLTQKNIINPPKVY